MLFEHDGLPPPGLEAGRACTVTTLLLLAAAAVAAVASAAPACLFICIPGRLHLTVFVRVRMH